jgi:lipopolysaccharide export system protein LptC
MSGRWLWVAVIAALVVTYALLTRNERQTGTPVARAPQPGYYLEDAVIVETGADGQPRVKLAARVIAQNAEDNSINLTDVRVDYTGDTERHWLLTSQHGFVPPDSQRIQFTGHVQIQDIAGENAPRANTERLELDMDKDIARTDAPVQITFGPHLLSSRGLWADLKGETLRLESQVNGHFSPK